MKIQYLPADAIQDLLWHTAFDAATAEPFIIIRASGQRRLEIFNASKVVCAITKLTQDIWFVVNDLANAAWRVPILIAQIVSGRTVQFL